MNLDLENILLKVSQSADIDGGELDRASRLIIDSVCEGLAITRAGIWLLGQNAEIISCQLLIDKGNDLDSESLILKRSDFPQYFAALDKERSIPAHDAITDSATAEFGEVYLTPLGITSMLDVPIRHRGKMIGIICCEHQGPQREWHDDEIVFSSSLADLYGRAVSAKERADYEAQLVEINHSLEQMVAERTKALEATRDKLIESEKMAALGNLVAGVAHEVNTPLGIALTSVSHCNEELKQTFRSFESETLSESQFRAFVDSCSEGLNLAEQSLMRAGKLVQDFKRTAADQVSLEEEEINLSEYIEQVINPLKPMLRKEQVKLNLELTSNIVITTCPGTIAQLLTNLLSNALRHAFIGNNPAVTNTIVVACDKTKKGVFIRVTDNGVGIPTELHKKIFEPFYTTAREQGGTGLGLPILYNLVTQKLNGEIDLTSSPNKGTDITVWILLY
ncbi:GAF domain-containing sensor histidine kinase [Alteromonas sp. KUL49]|uniref:GAF domain-containing sensor histidine kinase n=1 Tax=Alteromonas sp. KUL49 TaxID=2480798 RepID=UPI00102F1517|nr:GAF domain-containing sensor histidine kinase [Alteromonas sp. KUL49]TAP36820.1 GAF domain-containing sensor histidine kinase [Alteromonas sp. KUL49]GEA13075.1 diguanylate cyclase [Alteromonas sp. KUL49]